MKLQPLVPEEQIDTNMAKTVKADRKASHATADNNKRPNPRKLQAKDLLNYKGNFVDNDKAAETRYSCPETGAHFEFGDMCKRLDALA